MYSYVLWYRVSSIVIFLICSHLYAFQHKSLSVCAYVCLVLVLLGLFLFLQFSVQEIILKFKTCFKCSTWGTFAGSYQSVLQYRSAQVLLHLHKGVRYQFQAVLMNCTLDL